MESNKYLTGRWLNGRKIMVAVTTCLLIATIVKIVDLANIGSPIVERGANGSTESVFECIVGEDYYTSQARKRSVNFNFSVKIGY